MWSWSVNKGCSKGLGVVLRGSASCFFDVKSKNTNWHTHTHTHSNTITHKNTHCRGMRPVDLKPAGWENNRDTSRKWPVTESSTETKSRSAPDYDFTEKIVSFLLQVFWYSQRSQSKNIATASTRATVWRLILGLITQILHFITSVLLHLFTLSLFLFKLRSTFHPYILSFVFAVFIFLCGKELFFFFTIN